MINMKQTYLVIKILTQQVFPSSYCIKSIRLMMKLVYSLIKNNGTLFTVKTLKTMRLHVTRYLCGKPLLVSPMIIGLTRDGFPKKLMFLKEKIDAGKPSDIRFCLTLLGISRAIRPSSKEEIPVDYSSITNKSTLSKGIPIDFIEKFVKDFNLKLDKPIYDLSDIFLSNKRGPNGHATFSAGKSLLGLPSELFSCLKELAPGLSDYFNDNLKYF